MTQQIPTLPVPASPSLPPVGEMSTDDMLRELVRSARELRTTLEPLLPMLADPGQALASMGPLGAVLGNFLKPPRG